MKAVATLEYDGGLFAGWQEQPKLVTVQGTLQRALATYFSSLEKKTLAQKAAFPEVSGAPDSASRVHQNLVDRIVVVGSGRTDSGVHAEGQVASFYWPDGLPFDEERAQRSINGILPPGVALRSLTLTGDSFDARYAPHVKQYRYRILLRGSPKGAERDRGWFIGAPLDLATMCSAARIFTGTHDFTEFRSRDCSAPSAVRTVLCSEFHRCSDTHFDYLIQGKGFLKQMVRILVGALVAVGRGRLSPDNLHALLQQSARRPSDLRVAPACGLCLEWVRYLERDYFLPETPDTIPGEAIEL